MAVPRRTTNRDGLGCTATHALRTVTEILPRRHVQARLPAGGKRIWLDVVNWDERPTSESPVQHEAKMNMA